MVAMTSIKLVMNMVMMVMTEKQSNVFTTGGLWQHACVKEEKNKLTKYYWRKKFRTTVDQRSACLWKKSTLATDFYTPPNKSECQEK
ncbi:hypothetical protein RRG08_012075 [Elysia crispata]|uniref:Uncharacterized protein n=1 Tax=Elysia crispata TaxID=231223 RepID=A0AAE1EEY4_9GAST|nr:hypothetical protein RRG08_012075 [Elysia crispata]